MDEVETLALELGGKLGKGELEGLAKMLTLISYGRAVEANGHRAQQAPAAKAAPEPDKTAPAAKGRGAKATPPPPDDDEPGF